MKTTTRFVFPLHWMAIAFAGLFVTNAGLTDEVTPKLTKLATEPFTSTNKLTARPNLMFVLDDSGSMEWDYLPDWAGPHSGINPADGVFKATPWYQFFNPAYNGVAYNPAIRYQPPVMYNADGTKNTIKYPSMTGQNTGTGGDSTASAIKPNWKSVKVDGYSVQSTARISLEERIVSLMIDTDQNYRDTRFGAFYYTTVPGEYCTSDQLRDCHKLDLPGVVGGKSYKYPAYLRWCTSAIKADADTAGSNGYCQASNIADTQTNRENGVTTYTFPRMPAALSATFTVTGGGKVESMTVEGKRIFAGEVTDASTIGLASKLVDAINQCTYVKLTTPSTAPCQTVGYRAELDSTNSAKVIVWAPAKDGAMAGAATGTATITATAFVQSNANVPGKNLLTVITSSVNSYPYPGSSKKHPDRVDCAGETCSYAEEMTNYANWFTYYRTRMQMMKTAASHAFTQLDENFRVGYYTLNNGASSQFLNVKDFDAAQKNLWYQKFLSAKPKDATPLRTGLSNIGRFYAGKLNGKVLNDVTVADPMQYSCQQNFTILSTDGYWNDNSLPVQLDGVTPIGQQDGNLPRPFYDGGLQVRQTTQEQKSTQQLGQSIWSWEHMTQQQQTSTEQLKKTEVTTTTWPFKKQEYQLEQQLTKLTEKTYPLEKKVYPLESWTKNLLRKEYWIENTEHVLDTYTNRVQQTIKPVIRNNYDLTKRIFHLQTTTYTVNPTETPVERLTWGLSVTTTPLVQNIYKLDGEETPLLKVIRKLKSETYQLQRSEYQIDKKIKKLYAQKYKIAKTTTPLTKEVWNFTKKTFPLQQEDYYAKETTTKVQQTVYKVKKSTYKLQRTATRLGGDGWQSTGWVDVATCNTNDKLPTEKDVKCRYLETTSGDGIIPALETCTATPMFAPDSYPESGVNPLPENVVYNVANVVKCEYKEQLPLDLAGNCTQIPKLEKPSYKQYATCAYTGAATSDDKDTCNPSPAPTGNDWPATQTTCSLGGVKTAFRNVSSACTVNKTDTSNALTDCRYSETASVTDENANVCTTQGSSGSPYTVVTKVTCAIQKVTTQSSTNASSCKPVNTASDGKTQDDNTKTYTACYYGTGATTYETACTKQDKGSGTGDYAGPAISCADSTKPDTSSKVEIAENDTCQKTPYTYTTTAVAKILCEYDSSYGDAVTVDTCTTQSSQTGTGSPLTFKPVVECKHQTTPVSGKDHVPVPSCTVDTGLDGNNLPNKIKVECTYASTSTPASNLTTCRPNDQGTTQTHGLNFVGDKVLCDYMALPSPVTGTEVNSCTRSMPPKPTASGTDCVYGGTPRNSSNTPSLKEMSECTVVAQVNNSADGTEYSGPARTCTYRTGASSTNNNASSCTPHAQDANTNGTTRKAEERCTWGTASGPVKQQSECSPKNVNASGNPVTIGTDTITGAAVKCAYDDTPMERTVQSALPTKTVGGKVVSACEIVPQNTSGATWEKAYTCEYVPSKAVTIPVSGCVARPQTTGAGITIDGKQYYIGPAISCAHSTGDPVITPNPGGTCTRTYDANEILTQDCTYVELTDRVDYSAKTCENKNKRPAVGDPPNTVYQGTVEECTRNESPFTSEAYPGGEIVDPAVTCTPKSGVITATSFDVKTTCGYGSVKETTVDSCTFANQANSEEASAAKRPKVTCAYVAEVLKGSEVACTPGVKNTGTTDGVTLDKYNSCKYRDLPKEDKNSCAKVDKSTLTVGTEATVTRARTCVYSTTPRGTADSWRYDTRNSGGALCTPVLQKSDFSAPEVTCTYEATATRKIEAVEDGKCTAGSQDYKGPEVECKFSTNYDETLSTLSASSPYCVAKNDGTYQSGAKVTCAYSETGTVTKTGQASCTTSWENGPTYTKNAKTECIYEAPSDFAPADTCQYAGVPVIEANPRAYWQGRDCRYVKKGDEALTDSCTHSPPPSVSDDQRKGRGAYEGHPYNYTLKNPVECTEGTFIDPLKKTVTTTVDSCSTLPTRTGNVSASPPTKQQDTLTRCEWLTPMVVDTVTCDPTLPASDVVNYSSAVPAYTEYKTRIRCPKTNPEGLYAPTRDCTPAGSPGVSDETGKIVLCKAIETEAEGTRAKPKPVAACTLGESYVAASNKHTACVQIPGKTTPLTGVAPGSCVAAAASEENDFVSTTCQTKVTPAEDVNNCLPQTPSEGNFWIKVECANKPGSGTSNTLADVAAYYYYADLRHPDLDNCDGAPVVIKDVNNVDKTITNNLCLKNDVPTTTTDDNPAQHMTTFTLGLGASGYMKYSESYLADANLIPAVGDYATVWGTGSHKASEGIEADPETGVCSWQKTGHCNWPPPKADEQTTIDDLWHAGVNGHGAYFSAGNPKALAEGIRATLLAVKAAGGAAAAPTVSAPSLMPTDSYFFRSTYVTSDWSGELQRLQIHSYTGSPMPKVDWSARDKLDAKGEANRNIFTFKGGLKTAFTVADFKDDPAFQLGKLKDTTNGLVQFQCPLTRPEICLSDENKTAAAGAELVKFLRGDRSNEGAPENNNTFFRQRASVLGDMVNAQVAYVQKPQRRFADPGYVAFAEAKAGRQAMVYAGANDGMLHAFAAKGSADTEAKVETAALADIINYLNKSEDNERNARETALIAETAIASDTTVAQEQWAYIPSMLLPELPKLADKEYSKKHRYFVDATPLAADICISQCDKWEKNESTGKYEGAVWKTILVGGLGGGGRGYYALDITDPANPNVLWEFTDANLGYTYGTPRIVKNKDGRWVALLSSGYNNVGDGKGRLYVLDAWTGAKVIEPLVTSAGGPGEPSGLAHIAAEVISPVTDATVKAAYGGDLLGNLWRFDINGNVGQTAEGESIDTTPQLLATLKDGDGDPQPITTLPALLPIPGVDAVGVFVGTGRLLHPDDTLDEQKQSFYAIKDAKAKVVAPNTAIYDNPRSLPDFVNQAQKEVDCTQAEVDAKRCRAGEKVLKADGAAPTVDWLKKGGWYFDLSDGGERVNTNPDIQQGMLAFTSNVPSVAACDMGGKSYLRFVNALTGTASSSSNGYLGRFIANALSSSVTLVMTQSGKLAAIVGTSSSGGGSVPGGTVGEGESVKGVFSFEINPEQTGAARRVSWRELILED